MKRIDEQQGIDSTHRPVVWIEMFLSFAGVLGLFFLLSAKPFLVDLLPVDLFPDEM
jgi:hypothetical protein